MENSKYQYSFPFYHKTHLINLTVVRSDFVLLVDVFSQHSAGQRVISLRSHAEGTKLQYQSVFFFHMRICWHIHTYIAL